jgi:transcription elongation factor GreA
MNDQPVYLTREGHERLDSELDHLLTVRRQEVAHRLHEALAEGDILENAELEAARNEQAFVEGRILELEALLRRVEIIEEGGGPGEVVRVGSRVTVVEGDGPPETYHIIGSAEAAPAEGKISYESPLGKALMDCRVGDDAAVNAPDGELVFRVVAIN